MDTSPPSSSTDGRVNESIDGEADSPSSLPNESSSTTVSENISFRKGSDYSSVPSSSAKKHQASSSPPSSSSSIESAKRQRSDFTSNSDHSLNSPHASSASSTDVNCIQEASSSTGNNSHSQQQQQGQRVLTAATSSSVSSSICHEEPSRSDDKRHTTTRSPVPDSPSTGSTSSFGHFFPGSFGSVAASPPKFVALDEIMKAANGVANMYLAHEIALNREFRLPDHTIDEVSGAGASVSPSTSTSPSGGPSQQKLQSAIKAAMRKAYWDILQSQLEESPPKYKQALAILEEIKGKLTALLLPQHSRLRQEIDEILDIELIKQQVEIGALDFPRYGQYILSVMARLCAPIRDEKIRELTQTAHVVTLFRGIMEVLELMELDWANFQIELIRPQLQQESIEYERKKFNEFLQRQSKFAMGDDPLLYTRKWLERNFKALDLTRSEQQQQQQHQQQQQQQDESCKCESEKPQDEHNSSASCAPLLSDKVIVDKVLKSAYSELLMWQESLQELFPETLLMDKNRFYAMRDQASLLTLIGSVILVTFATVGPSIQQLSSFKNTLKKHLLLILADVASTDQTKLHAAALQVCKEVKSAIEEHGLPPLDKDKEDLLTSQIVSLANIETSKTRQVLHKRIVSFIENVAWSTSTSTTGAASTSSATSIQVPAGLSTLQQELASLTGQFVKLVKHNRAVFGDYYFEIIRSFI